MLQLLMKGGKPLIGEVSINGAKNAALGILAAAIMADEPVLLENLPDVSDIRVMLNAIEEIGAKVDRTDRHTVRIDGGSIKTYKILTESVRKIRASYYLIGALLGKYKHAEVALPGGCAIGARPIDQHLKGFNKLGAVTEVTEYGSLMADAEALVGQEIFMDVVSVGATINVMLSAVLANGRTVIHSAAKEPHVVDVANLLNRMGAVIKGAGTDKIRIDGVEKLHGADYTIVPDQIEAGTFMMAAAASDGDITIRNVIPTHLDVIADKLKAIGCTVLNGDDYVRVIGNPDKDGDGVAVKTRPYPGYPTDMQPQTATVLALSKGDSKVIEKIFENRFGYVAELNAMGADIDLDPRGDRITIHGAHKLHGADIWAHDLRAGAALTIAGLCAEGYTIISDVKFILRGYEDFDYKLQALGGEIVTVHNLEEADAFFAKTGAEDLTLELEKVTVGGEEKEFAHVVKKAVTVCEAAEEACEEAETCEAETEEGEEAAEACEVKAEVCEAVVEACGIVAEA